MGISKRLKTIADLVTPGRVIADIGTDHGYVPIYLLRNDICPKALACDLSAGSLAKAKENADFFHLSDRIECRLSDGFDKIIPGEVNAAVISGMGGILMTRILSDAKEHLEYIEELVLSPHRDAGLVRIFLADNGFEIVSDIIFEDKGKNYVIIKALKKC